MPSNYSSSSPSGKDQSKLENGNVQVIGAYNAEKISQDIFSLIAVTKNYCH